MRLLAKIYASNIEQDLLFVPVCIQFHLYKSLSCDIIYDLNHLLYRTYVLGKL